MVYPAVLLLQYFIWISLMATGVQEDNVTHIITSMCVVQKSTVLIPCKYIHPQHEQVSSVEWLHEKSPEEEVRVSQDTAFEGRVEFVQSDERNCSLILRDVRKSDAGTFHLVHNTTSGQIRMNAKGIRLDVTDAEVEVQNESDIVMEGDWILFICGSCIPSMTATYIWRKDGRLHSQHRGENFLYLESVGLEDRGRYLCTLNGHEGLNYTSVNITARPEYPPRSVSVSVSGSGVIVEGDSVTLNCISDSNPPALNFSWFKENETSAVGSGQSFSISSFNSSFSGRFYCEAQNKHGSRRSASVSLTVKVHPPSVFVSLITVTAGITASVVLTVILMLVVWLLIRRKRVTPSEEQNHRGSRHHKTVESPEDAYTTLEPKSPEDAYMTLDPKSRCSEYDTLDNMKRSCDTDDPEDQEST